MKKDAKKQEEVERDPCCQDCGHHTNHPSYCHKFGKYVGRKNPLCSSANVRKGGK